MQKNLQAERQVAHYWKVMALHQSGDDDMTDEDLLSELEALAVNSDSEALRQLCHRTIVRLRPLHVVGAS